MRPNNHYRIEFENGDRRVIEAENAMLARMRMNRETPFGPGWMIVKITRLRPVPAYGYPSGWRYIED